MDTDYLTCGQCLKEFPLQKINLFIQHKKLECEEDAETQVQDTDLKCYYCPRGFMSAWGLLVHVQLTHNLRIFVERTSLSLSRTTNQEKINHLPQYDLKFQTITTNTVDSNKESGLLINTSSVTEMGDLDIIDTAKTSAVGDYSEEGRKDEQTERGNETLLGGTQLKLNAVKQESRNVALLTERTESANITNSTDKSLQVSFSQKSEDRTVLNQAIDSKPLVERVKPVTLLSRLSAPVNPAITITGSGQDISSNSSIISCAQNSTPTTSVVLETPKPVSVGDSLFAMDTKKSSSRSNERTEQEGIDSREPADTIDDSETTDSHECCDDQGCGITVIPGSHQDLQKCCNAVVPKKRKRHMEMKHMPFSWSSSRYARRRMLQRSFTSASKSNSISHVGQSKSGTNTIYIDVEPDTFTAHDNATENADSNKEEVPVSESISGATDLQSVPMKLLPSGSDSKIKSLILQPGAVFSIPFSYNVPSSLSGASSSIPISIIHTLSEGNQTDSIPSTNGKLVPISTQKLDQGQLQMSRVEESEVCSSPGEITESDIRRRKYPTSKPFQCDKCPMAFNQRIHLKKHMSKHTGIKPYKCGECDYSTVERSHLKVHIRIHTGEKPFKCTYCEYATAQNSTLKIHLKRHHSDKKSFALIEPLKGHETDHLQLQSSTSVETLKTHETEQKRTEKEFEKHSPKEDRHVPAVNESVGNKNGEPADEDLGHVLSIPENVKENQFK